MPAYAALLDLLRQVQNTLQPQHGGTGSDAGEGRVVKHALNSTGATLALHTLVEYTYGANDNRVRKVAATDSKFVLGVIVGYYAGSGELVEAGCPDGYEAAVLTAGDTPVLIGAAVTRGQYAYAHATDGTAYSSATAAAGSFGTFLSSADPGAGHTTALVSMPLTAGVIGTGATGAPDSADYLVGTANAGLSGEIVVGTTPGGELGGTWASPTVDATHSGSAHHTEDHDHDGSPTQKLAQANTHQSADTDSADGALHHTLGTAATNAAKGNHSHGASGGTVPIYLPDAAPASAHADDDEFADASIGGAWTQFDPGSAFTFAEGDNGLEISRASSNAKWAAVYRAIPSGDWALMVHAVMNCDIPAASQEFDCGMLLMEGSPPGSTSDFYAWAMRTEVAAIGRDISLARWSDYQTFNANVFAATAAHSADKSDWFLRIRRISGTYFFDWSSDGIGWTESVNISSPAFTISQIGLGVWAGSARSVKGYFRFYRRVASTNKFDRVLGQTLNL
jgi:hypothetical protein